MIQDFETSLDDNDTLAADDFTVPAGQTWTLERALVDGRALDGVGTTNLVNVFLFNNVGTLPDATPFYSMAPLTADASRPTPTSTWPFPSVPALGPGTYWFGAQARLDFNADPNDNTWLWSVVATQRGNKAAYRNPGNGFDTGCTTFAVMDDCVTEVNKPDMSFRLEGTCAGCPVAPTPPAPAPPAKKCKKGKKLKKGKCVKKKKKKKKK